MFNWPKPQIHNTFLVTTLIKIKDTIGTGFFFKENGCLYIVTNKHVLIKPIDKKPISDYITIRLHTSATDLSQNEEVVIQLFDEKGNRKWLEHKNPSVDVVLLPVDLESKFVIRPLDRSFIDGTSDLLVQFEKLLIVGYPHGWHDHVFNFPIVRIGHLSSPFKIPFEAGEPYMIGDVISHEGMSGGPALIQLEKPINRDKKGGLSLIGTGKKYILAGVYSAGVGLPGTCERPNLVNIWFAELILEILEYPN